jgi:isopenicillin N synthase-like dioxygenase
MWTMLQLEQIKAINSTIDREAIEDNALRSLRQIVSEDNARSVICDYFHNAEQLSKGILHAMSAAKVFAQDICEGITRYQCAWRDEHQYCNLRLLSYHPGPESKSSGEIIQSTARHTDATWLTLLWNDDVKGLHINPRNKDIPVMPPIQGALLVNT